MPGRDEEKGKSGGGRSAWKAGILESMRSSTYLEPRVSRGDKAGEVSMTQTGHEGLIGQADKLELDSAGRGEVLQQGYARSG